MKENKEHILIPITGKEEKKLRKDFRAFLKRHGRTDEESWNSKFRKG